MRDSSNKTHGSSDTEEPGTCDLIGERGSGRSFFCVLLNPVKGEEEMEMEMEMGTGTGRR